MLSGATFRNEKAKTYSEEFSQARVVRFAGFALGVLDIFCQPEADNFKHAVERLVGITNGNEGIGSVEVGPVFEVRRGLEKLRGQRKSDCGEISNADESEQQRKNLR